jgi:hypothetical protein
MQYRTKTALEILNIIEFDRDALEEEPVVKIGKRKRTSEASTVPNDISIYVRSDSEELAASTWSSDPVYDREELARENAELKVRLFSHSPFDSRSHHQRQLRIANMRNPGEKGSVADAVDLTAGDSEDEDEEKVVVKKEEPKRNGWS